MQPGEVREHALSHDQAMGGKKRYVPTQSTNEIFNKTNKVELKKKYVLTTINVSVLVILGFCSHMTETLLCLCQHDLEFLQSASV